MSFSWLYIHSFIFVSTISPIFLCFRSTHFFSLVKKKEISFIYYQTKKLGHLVSCFEAITCYIYCVWVSDNSAITFEFFGVLGLWVWRKASILLLLWQELDQDGRFFGHYCQFLGVFFWLPYLFQLKEVWRKKLLHKMQLISQMLIYLLQLCNSCGSLMNLVTNMFGR